MYKRKRREPIFSEVEIKKYAMEKEVEDDNDDLIDDVEDEMEDNDNGEWEDTEDDDDDLTFTELPKRKAQLAKGIYEGQVGNVIGEKQTGENGNSWMRVTIYFYIKKPGGKEITVAFWASKSLSPMGRLYPIVEGIIGKPPQIGFNLKTLEGKCVKVQVGHYEDKHGNIWEEVIAIKKNA